MRGQKCRRAPRVLERAFPDLKGGIGNFLVAFLGGDNEYATELLPIMNTDRIEKKITLRAPRSKVWRAIAEHEQFGTWFEVKLDRPFVAGARVNGQILTKGYEHLKFELVVAEVKPETYLSFRWHPYAIDPAADYSKEPMTLVEFRLSDAPGGHTELVVTESGFDQIPASRREEAFRMNDGGWAEQVKNVERYVTR
jgi:uncharacterized protein YndB with AHSA1/START domain